jgi:hypothetical protein
MGHPFPIRVASLEDLRRLPPPRLVPANSRVELALPVLDAFQREYYERRLSRELAACGCREGSIAVLLYCAAVPLLAFLGMLSLRTVTAWIVLFVGLLAVSISGKIIGLTIAAARLRRLADELASIVRESGGD